MVEVKIKKKPKRRPTTKEIVESANRINKAERLEEIRAKNKKKKDKAVMEAERKRRIYYKNKANKFGK